MRCVVSPRLCADVSKASGLLGAANAKPTWTVEAVVAKIPGGPPATDSESPVPFFHMLERLKTTKREGWRRFGIGQLVPYPLRLMQEVC
jgi:putative hydrolase of HD superfamily